MLSLRAKNLKPSPTLALAAKAKELRSQGHDVISLSVGEPDWDTFEKVKAAGIEAIKEGVTKYTPSNGIPALREAIAKQTNQDLNMDYSSDQVSVTTGAKFSIFSALQVLCDPGDEVLIPAPYWVSYPTMSELAGAKPVMITCGPSTHYKLSADLLKASITNKTKVLILNSPSNPTGYLYSKEELKGIAQVLIDYPDIIILSDDIYNRLVFEGDLAPHILQAEPKLVDRTLIINGLSKTYSMTGWRVGWAVGPIEIIGAMNKYQSQSVSCASGFSQQAAITAINETKSELAEALVMLKKRRDFVYQEFSKIDGLQVSPPEGAFYIWADISGHLGKLYKGNKLDTSSDFAKYLLESQMVVSVPGIEFGLDGYLRVSFAINEKSMSEAVSRIKTYIGELKC